MIPLMPKGVEHDWIESFNGAAQDFVDSLLHGRQP
jgi:hypothetical protein